MNRHSQQGAALITGLVIMVVMSLVGIAAMETAVLQTNLASNAQFKAITYQETEAALQRGSTLEFMQLAMKRDPDDDRPNFTYDINLSDTYKLGNQEAAGGKASATTLYCGTLASTEKQGIGLDANQAANSGGHTFHVFDVDAAAALTLGGKARSEHTQRSSRPMLRKGGATVC